MYVRTSVCGVRTYVHTLLYVCACVRTFARACVEDGLCGRYSSEFCDSTAREDSVESYVTLPLSLIYVDEQVSDMETGQ